MRIDRRAVEHSLTSAQTVVIKPNEVSEGITEMSFSFSGIAPGLPLLGPFRRTAQEPGWPLHGPLRRAAP